MPDMYRIFGTELSPYSVKVRSYFRYKQLPHEWIVRTPDRRGGVRALRQAAADSAGGDAGRARHAGLDADHRAASRRSIPEPSIHPPDPALAFVSALIEEYADEWGNKPMFHYRWFYEPDQESAGERLARSMMPGLDEAELAERRRHDQGPHDPAPVVRRLVGRRPRTRSRARSRASSPSSSAISPRAPYLFGGRPAFADFGLYAQLYQCSTDPTPAALMRASAPHVVAWIERMLDPRAEGDFETWATLAPTLPPLLRDEIGGVFLPWTTANAKALAAGEKQFTVTSTASRSRQETQKYHAKSLAALQGALRRGGRQDRRSTRS